VDSLPKKANEGDGQGQFQVEISATGGSVAAGAAKSWPQKGQNLSVSKTSRLHCGQDGCKLDLQLGQ
jgi:hypothetical protein